MFTGIVQKTGRLAGKKKAAGQTRLEFEITGGSWNLKAGESLAVDGVCLTVVSFQGKKFSADVIPETLRATTLGRLKTGDPVNLERALRMGDPLGGHWVTGHVDTTGLITQIRKWGGNFEMRIQIPAVFSSCLVPKGSIAVDGISFTLQGISKNSFQIGVIPHTYRVTSLQGKKAGSAVNLEIDFFAKMVKRLLSEKGGSSLREKDLMEQGF